MKGGRAGVSDYHHHEHWIIIKWSLVIIKIIIGYHQNDHWWSSKWPLVIIIMSTGDHHHDHGRCIALEKTLAEAASCLDGEEGDLEVITDHLPFFVIICHFLVIICHFCDHLLLFVIICYFLWSFSIFLWSFVMFCDNLPFLVIICHFFVTRSDHLELRFKIGVWNLVEIL